MSQEIERKFFPLTLPNVEGVEKTSLDRYFLFNQNGIELRIQSNGKRCTMQRKVSISETSRGTQEWEISSEEFEALKQCAVSSLQRESYHLSDNPVTDLRIYKGAFTGLVRLEFEFSNQEACDSFIPEDWMGKEITSTDLARDGRLLKLEKEQFTELLRQNS